MDKTRFQELHKMAALLQVAETHGDIVAFLMAFTDGADYDSPNYRWFSRRLKDFLYIDRVVVSEKVRSSGIGRQLYSEIEKWGRSHDLSWLAAEVDTQPPNSASLRFHHQQHFTEVARHIAGDGKKEVSLQVKSIRE